MRRWLPAGARAGNDNAVDGGGLGEVKARLLRELGDRVGEDEINRVVDEEAAKFEDAEIDKFVPVLVERRARKRLRRR